MTSATKAAESESQITTAQRFDLYSVTDEERHDLSHHVAHIAHMLSEQGPMSITFVHNNTLLGLQDMHFEAAIKKAEGFTGGQGFLENDAYRAYYDVGRITDADIDTALATRDELKLDETIAQSDDRSILSGEVYRLNLIHGFDAVSAERLNELLDTESGFDTTVSEETRAKALASADADVAALSGIKSAEDFALWLDTTLGLGLEADQFGNGGESLVRAISRAVRTTFDIEPTPEAMAGYIKANPQSWVAKSQWCAVLSQLGLTTARTEPSLATVAGDAALNGEPMVAIDSDTHAQITGILSAEIEALDKSTERTGADVARTKTVWTVLHGLSDKTLDRSALTALELLLAQRGANNDTEAELATRLRQGDPRTQMLDHAATTLKTDLDALASGQNHADFLAAITDDDIVKTVNDYMIGVCSAFFDEGLAAWHMPSRATGFYDSWRNLTRNDRSFDFDGITDWRDKLDQLPLSATDAVIMQLGELGIPKAGWSEYCGRALAHLRGWAGMVFWRQENEDYARQQAQPIDLMQYLAVRLFYQNLLVTKICTANWSMFPEANAMDTYFSNNLGEYFVRRELFAGILSDDLAQEARTLINASGRGQSLSQRWQVLADRAWAEYSLGEGARDASNTGWRLFRLCQHLGLSAEAIRRMTAKDRDALIEALDTFSGTDHGPVWLLAFEKNYRDEICNALALNRGKGRWLDRKERPKSQVVFCIDEREESIHRHYEELDPGHETMGAAGFFGVAMDYQALDDHGITPLCPAPVTPEHRILEVARPQDQGRPIAKHKSRAKWAEVFHDTYWEMKRNPISSYFLIDVSGFLMAIPLIGRLFFPLKYFQSMASLGRVFVPAVETQLAVGRDADDTPAGPVADGFTLIEQADRIEGLLRNIGLLKQFAPIVVVCAHGSHSENNPHENAHDCGACGGKGGAPNSRAVAAMANNPEVRKLLAQRDIVIPDDTWFVGALHNTASEVISLMDEVDIPSALRPQFEEVKRDLDEAVRRAARERCRRFASAPKDVDLDKSLHHTMSRALDFSQVRPEWGHATNACAIVGRRALSQGLFFDRRSFIISYDPTTDPEGTVLERILLAVGPVGAGINLEYYFSTVDPQIYGCDTKVPHNVTGLVGVMEGAHSDLRTGLPRQMTEVHEAMRLHLIVDASPAIAGEIYGRQPGIQQLLDNEWVLLIVHDPENGDLLRFVPGVGFEKWDDSNLQEIPEVSESYDWFKGKHECFLPPARITEPSKPWLS